MKKRQQNNEIRSVNRIYQEIIFFFQNYAENKAGRLVPGLFLFFLKKLNFRRKQVAGSLVSIYFDSPQLDIQ